MARGAKIKALRCSILRDIAKQGKDEMDTATIESPERMATEDFLSELDKHKVEFASVARGNLWYNIDLEDVIAEARMAAWEHLGSFTAGTNFRAWFHQILLNKCYVANRRRMRVNCDGNIEEARSTEPRNEAPVFRRNPIESISDDVYEALTKLPDHELRCLYLRAWKGLSYREIAARLEIPIGTVMTHLHRGRTKLRKQLRHRRRLHAPC